MDKLVIAKIDVMTNNDTQKRYFLMWFRKWEDSTGKKQSVSAFARHLGFNQVTLNRWMNGDSAPEGDNLHLLALKLDDGIYEACGAKKPVYLSDVSMLAEILPSEWAGAFKSSYFEYNAELQSKGIPKDSPEGKEIIKKAFSKHGIEITVKH